MPKPFFTKLVAISAIGFFCVLFGCIFGIATHDRLFILMSLLIGICSILRALSFYHLIHTHAYLSGRKLHETGTDTLREKPAILVCQ